MERLFEYLEIDQMDRSKHRLYFNEVIELSDDVSVILVLPPSETVCFLETSDDQVSSNSNCSINLNRNDMMLLPLPMFELVHYVRAEVLISKFSNVNCIFFTECLPYRAVSVLH